jgi:hypothetical protein
MKQLLKIKDTILEDEIIEEIKKDLEIKIRLEYETKIIEIPHVVYCLINGNINDESLYDNDTMIISKKIVNELTECSFVRWNADPYSLIR